MTGFKGYLIHIKIRPRPFQGSTLTPQCLLEVISLSGHRDLFTQGLKFDSDQPFALQHLSSDFFIRILYDIFL